ncbi:MAG TPA: hydrogenase maturation protease [Ilumatobacter sp.]|nr:hydrogenase maturation protease [Ilumatobacter sp.]
MTDLLVIGYGNDLRSDDGAGRAVADAVAGRELAGVEVRTVSQLTPELSIEIAGRSLVVFVDADVDATELNARPVSAGTPIEGVMTHHGDPSTLLSLTAAVGPVPDEAILISIPAENLEMGFSFSPATERAVAQAVDLITNLACRET